MTKETRKELETRLDQTAVRWKAMSAGGNESAAQACRNQLWLLLFALYDQESQTSASGRDAVAVMDTIEEALSQYSPEKGAFSHYFSFLFSRRKTDAYRYDKRHAPDGESLDSPLSEDGRLRLAETLEGSAEFEPESTLRVDGLLADLTSLILNFSARTGRAGNERRRMWYRLFYTEDMTMAMKVRPVRFLHERDIFQAMDTEYLDYYMAEVCRDGQAVMNTRLKRYCDAVPEDTRTDELPLPLPAGVSLCYLRTRKGVTAGAAARSNQEKEYKREKAEIYSS